MPAYFLAWLYFCIIHFMTTVSTYDPEFDLPLANLTAKQGTDISFTCVVKHLREYRVAWIKADDKAIISWHTNMVTNNHRYSVTHNGHNTWTLHIKNVQQMDSGTYMCQVNTDPMRMQVGTLEVVVPADIIDEETSSDVAVSEGQSVVLQCKATGHPTPKIRWKRQDGQPLPLSKELLNPGEKLEVWEGETLPLRPLSREHTGSYLCIANNSYPPLVSKRVRVLVQIPPLIKTSTNFLGAPVEVNATLECEVESVPKPFVSWGTIDGQKLIMNTKGKYLVSDEPINDYKLKIKLTIFNLQPQDFTEYNVTAVNSIGEASAVIKLQRIFPPPTPKPSTTTTHRNLKHTDHNRLNNITGGKHSKFHRKNSNGRGSSTHGGGHGTKSRNHFEDSSSSFYEDVDFNNEGGHVTTMVTNYHHYNNHNNNNSNSDSVIRHSSDSTQKPNIWGKSANTHHNRRNCANKSLVFLVKSSSFLLSLLTNTLLLIIPSSLAILIYL